MKIIQLHTPGVAEQLVYEEASEPACGAEQVRVEVAAAGVNPIDFKTRQGGGVSAFMGELPWVLGWECAGVITEVGADVNQWQVGDRVAGLLNFPQPGNCYAEQVLASADQLALVPEAADLRWAGGLPLVGLTAWQALFEVAGLSPEPQTEPRRVLVLGAAGAVGHLVVQLAKGSGHWVAGVASAANQAYLHELGCDVCCDYQKGNLARGLEPMDIIIDAAGADAAIPALAVLKPAGVMVTLPSVTATQVIEAARAQGKQVVGMRVHPDAEQLAQLLQRMAEGQLQLRQDKTLPLSAAGAAHNYLESGQAKGKLLLVP